MSKVAEEGAKSESSAWTQVKGVCKIGLAIGLFTYPPAALAAAVCWVGSEAINRYRNDTDHKKSVVGRMKDTCVGMLGALAGTKLPMIGLAAAAVGIAYGAYSGHTEIASAGAEGLAVGAVVSNVLMPVVAAICVAEGAYNLATGKELNIIGKCWDVLKSVKRGVDVMLGRVDTSTREAGEKLAAQAKEVVEQGKVVETVKGAAKGVIHSAVADAAKEAAAGAIGHVTQDDKTHKPSPPPAEKGLLSRLLG